MEAGEIKTLWTMNTSKNHHSNTGSPASSRHSNTGGRNNSRRNRRSSRSSSSAARSSWQHEDDEGTRGRNANDAQDAGGVSTTGGNYDGQDSSKNNRFAISDADNALEQEELVRQFDTTRANEENENNYPNSGILSKNVPTPELRWGFCNTNLELLGVTHHKLQSVV